MRPGLSAGRRTRPKQVQVPPLALQRGGTSALADQRRSSKHVLRHSAQLVGEVAPLHDSGGLRPAGRRVSGSRGGTPKCSGIHLRHHDARRRRRRTPCTDRRPPCRPAHHHALRLSAQQPRPTPQLHPRRRHGLRPQTRCPIAKSRFTGFLTFHTFTAEKISRQDRHRAHSPRRCSL